MDIPKVWSFFYGSFINLDVLRILDVTPEKYQVARLSGFDIRIQPLANLVRSDRDCVYGIVALTSHDELRRLYNYAKSELGTVYLPEAVVVETLDGKWRPALCYLAASMVPRPPNNDYIDRIVGPAKDYGFPDWYIARLETFRS
jgi:Gamma-glutamyl cyclotransferase, AIG2-like